MVVEGRGGEVCVRNGGGLETIIGRERKKTIIGDQKTCKNTFFDLTTAQNVCKTFSLWCRPPAK